MSTVNYFYDWDFDDTKHRFTIDINNYSSDIIPLDITSLSILFNAEKDIDFKFPITFPTSITYLNLNFFFTGYGYFRLQPNIESILRDFIIPSSIKTLELQFHDNQHVFTLKEVSDVTTTILSTNIKNLKRKHQCIGNSNSNSENERNDHSNCSFIPSTVVELIIPSIDDSIIKLIPPTVTTLRLRNQLCDLDIQDLKSLIHLDVTSGDTGITIISIPSSIQTITIGNNITLACDLNRNVQVNNSYYIQQFHPKAQDKYYESTILYKLRDHTNEDIISNRVKQMFDYRYYVSDNYLSQEVENVEYYSSGGDIKNLYKRKLEKGILQDIGAQEKYIIPDGIEYLSIEWPYYIDLCNSTLKYLKITTMFQNPDIPQIKVPNTTTHLELPLGWSYNFNSIPRSVTHLKINAGLTYKIYVPSTVQYISCSSEAKSKIIIIDEKDYYFTFSEGDIDNGIKKLSLIARDGRCNYLLPPTIEEFSLDNGLKEFSWGWTELPRDLIPHSVKKLRISPDSLLENLPPSLTSIDYNDGVMP